MNSQIVIDVLVLAKSKINQDACPVTIQTINNLLAELEAGKPEEDALDCACDVFDCTKIEDDGVEAYPVADTEKGAILIQQYADSYHAKKCAESKQKKQSYKLFGVEDLPDNETAALKRLEGALDIMQNRRQQ